MRIGSDFFWAVATLYGEARGESFAGKTAVGEVIRNRCKASGKSVAEEVLRPLAFSTWNPHDPNRIHAALIDDTDPVVVDCANAWIASQTSEMVDGATNYWNPDESSPAWADQVLDPIRIGKHLFGTAV